MRSECDAHYLTVIHSKGVDNKSITYSMWVQSGLPGYIEDINYWMFTRARIPRQTGPERDKAIRVCICTCCFIAGLSLCRSIEITEKTSGTYRRQNAAGKES